MRLTKTQWANHVRAWRSSGTPAREYCEKRGLKLSSLRYWSERIRREAAEALDEKLEGRPARFAKVRRTSTKAASPPRAAISEPLRVVVGDVRVEVGAEFDADTLRRLLEVLGSMGGGR